jgi:hypothetical protein
VELVEYLNFMQKVVCPSYTYLLPTVGTMKKIGTFLNHRDKYGLTVNSIGTRNRQNSKSFACVNGS